MRAAKRRAIASLEEQLAALRRECMASPNSVEALATAEAPATVESPATAMAEESDSSSRRRRQQRREAAQSDSARRRARVAERRANAAKIENLASNAQ